MDFFDKEDELCLPEVKEIEDKYHSADYNCCFCNQSDCVYWYLYHHKDVLED